MKLEYEKHQRDYTVLATSIVLDEFFSKAMYSFFPFKPKTMFIVVKYGVLYHYISKNDYHKWAQSWQKNNNYLDLKKYIEKIDKHLIKYRKFLKSKKNNTREALVILNQYIRDFLPIIIIVTYVPMYSKNINKKIYNLCIKTRKKYEDVHKIGITLQERLLNKLEKINKLKPNTLGFLTTYEFDNYLKTGTLPKNIITRKSFSIFSHYSHKTNIYTGSKAKTIYKEINDDKKEKTNIIKGIVAYPGKISGKVHLVKLIKDINNLKKGEILITGMTDPRYVTAMKKAKAIVTDEGGVTCHAAIVARELNISCVIGTKIATQVFKDGDLVEVDANKGIVKIIK